MPDSASRTPAEKLGAGLTEVEPLLAEAGFRRLVGDTGSGSGGPFASVAFAKEERRLLLWLRFDSLSVTYRLGGWELDHAAYMQEMLGSGGPNRFPAYAEDSDAAFRAFRHDIEHYCQDFLTGPGEEFRRLASAAEETSQLSGAQRLAHIEEQLRRK